MVDAAHPAEGKVKLRQKARTLTLNLLVSRHRKV